MSSLSVSWESIIDFIALHGENGAIVSEVFKAMPINENLKPYILSRLSASGLCRLFVLGDSTLIESSDIRNHLYTNMLCIADISLSWKAYGLESYHEVPEDAFPLILKVFQILGVYGI